MLTSEDGRMQPTIACSSTLLGRPFAILQVDKGAIAPMPGTIAFRGLPRTMREAFYIHRDYQDGDLSNFTHARGYWEYRKEGAQKTVAAIFFKGRGYSLPMRIDGIILSVGLGLVIMTVCISIQLKTKIEIDQQVANGNPH